MKPFEIQKKIRVDVGNPIIATATEDEDIDMYVALGERADSLTYIHYVTLGVKKLEVKYDDSEKDVTKKVTYPKGGFDGVMKYIEDLNENTRLKRLLKKQNDG